MTRRKFSCIRQGGVSLRFHTGTQPPLLNSSPFVPSRVHARPLVISTGVTGTSVRPCSGDFSCGRAAAASEPCPQKRFRLGYSWPHLKEFVDGGCRSAATVPCTISGVVRCNHAADVASSHRSLSARAVYREDVLGSQTVGATSMGGMGSTETTATLFAGLSQAEVDRHNFSLANTGEASRAQQKRVIDEVWGRWGPGESFSGGTLEVRVQPCFTSTSLA